MLEPMTRSEKIHSKGFQMTERYSYYREDAPNEYKSIKVGLKTLDDAVLRLGSVYDGSQADRGRCPRISKQTVIKALFDHDLPELRKISNIFYNTSGIYQRVCNYFAFLYRYDWYVAPTIYGDDVNMEKLLKNFASVLEYLDNSYIKKLCGEIALEVIKNGAYYGYLVNSSKSIILQQLPVSYCRSRYNVGNNPAIEFDMRFFDTFGDTQYRMKVLKLFPDEFAKGYILYKQGKLKPDFAGDTCGSWYLLDPANTIKFSFYNNDVPMFVNAIPSILDLDAAQDLDRRKQMQQLLKILVQKLPRDKNGDLIFDVEEARDIHNNAVMMLKRAIGVDVLTTFTDVESINLSDRNTTATTDDLEKVERTVYNSLGISRNLFNTDGNLSLEKSILNDESSVRNLLLQFSQFFDRVTNVKYKNSKYVFKFYMLETTQYNYKELAKVYKEQTQIGYSKMLPQIALGHSQSFILNSAHFENEVLKLHEIMIPPLMSSTMSSESVLGAKDQEKTTNPQKKKEDNSGEKKEAGRPEKSDDQKSEKTIQNKESMS